MEKGHIPPMLNQWNVAATTQQLHFISSGISDAIISPPWLGSSSLERWKSRIDFTVQ